MKAFVLAMLAALSVTPYARAADMPIKAPYVSPVYAGSWSGMYYGLEGGMNLGKFSPFCASTVCGPEGTTVNLDDNNWFIGGHIGFLAQSGNFVIGPELGVQYWGMKGKADLIPATEENPSLSLQQRLDWVAYANVKAGLLVTPGLMVYLTGGPAWAHVKGSLNINVANLDTTNEQSIFGLNIGGGLAYKLSEYVILSGEYRHYDFGKVSAANPVFNLMGIGNSDRLTTDQAMARLSFRIN
jgi:outer membrane immunogenic protein